MPTVAPPDKQPRRRHGVALVLVMIALLVGTALAVSFLSQQATSTAIAQNVSAHAEARAIAESALEVAINHVNTDAAWRSTLPNGQWAADVAFEDGTYSVWGVDGLDANADGVISGDETDGDLEDDAADPVTITVTATIDGVTHTVRATVAPSEVPLGPITVLLIVADPDNLTGDEESRKDLIESWGWTVSLLAANADAGAYAAAMSGVHVVYVPEDGGNDTVGVRLADTSLGVVVEDGSMLNELGLSTGSSTWYGDTVRIVDNTHYITAPFGIGELQFASGTGKVEYPGGTVTGALRELAWRPDDDDANTIAVIDAGATLTNGSSAKGRRTVSPFNGFSADDLTSDGKLLLKRMLEWDAMSALTNSAIEPITNWVNGTTIHAAAGEDRLLVVTVGSETHETVTSISYGNVPLTIAASAYESTGVGARTYVYYLRESGIAAATDSVLRVNWSGSADDKAYASRMYQFVNQTTPIRVTNTNTNAGPESISTAPLEVSNGDLVIGSAQVGQPYSYAWSDPIEMGVNDVNSSSTHTAGDYEVTDDPGEVTVTATVNSPNRQALIGVVLQPRSQSSGEGVIPQVLALYEFEETQPTVELVGHWPLDDDGDGGALILDDAITMEDDSLIDGYHSSDGDYGSSNKNKPVILVTDTSSGSGISLRNDARLVGSTYNAPGANPTTVVSISGNAEITGNRYEQSVSFSLPSLSSPSGSFNYLGSKTYGSGTTTLSSDTRYNDLTINNNATLRISGNVRVWVSDDFDLNGGTVLVPAGSTLELYVADTFQVRHGGRINVDTDAPDRVEVYHYNSGRDLNVEDDSYISGTVNVARDLIMEDEAAVYGAVYVRDDVSLYDDAAIHVDLDLPGYHIVPVLDDTAVNDGLANGGASFNQSGARSFTNTSMRFDGSDDFVLIPHHDDYLLHHGAVSLWFYSENLSGHHAIFSKDSYNFDTGGHLHLYTDGSTLKARLQTDGSNPYGNGNEFTVTKSGLSTNTWYHVVFTFGAGGMRLYVNGSLVDTEDYSGGLATSSGGIGNYEPLVLGAGTWNSGDLTHLPLNYYFRGRIDDVRIYKEVLDAGQVDDLYHGDPLGDRTEPSYVVRDTSGLGDPLDLFIDDTAAVSWEPDGGLTIDSPTLLRAPSPPAKIYNGATATGEFTIELTLTHAAVDTTARRLLWFGASAGSNTNLDVYARYGSHVARVRNADTNNNPPDVSAADAIVAGMEHHVLVTFDGTSVRFYVDGLLTSETDQPGNLLNWDDAYSFTLANTPTASSPWLGTLKRVAVYDRAMNQRQADNLYQGLPPGDGASTTAGAGGVRWIEP